MELMEALQLIQQRRAGARRRFCLACGFTPLHLRHFLQAHALLLFPEDSVEVEVGLFGDLAGNLERAAAGGFDGVAVAVEWADLDTRLGLRQLGGWGPGVLGDLTACVQTMRERLQGGLDRLQHISPVALSLPTLPLPPAGYTPGWQAGAFELRLLREAACLGDWAAAQPRLRVLNPQRLDVVSPPGERWDVKSDLLTGYPYRQGHAEKLGGLLAAVLRNAGPKKGLITDLDDTLWRGILGEAGLDGISWDLEHHSQIHAVYQQFLDALAERGVLIAAASKNDPALAAQAFRRPDLRIAAHKIFPAEVHWGPKSESVGRILAAWNIAADSVVFVDDSPMELAEVRSAWPDIECVLFPKSDPDAALNVLEHLRDLFGKSILSQEDRLRGESLRAASALREAAASGSRSLDDFLANTAAEIELALGRGPGGPRVLELVNKTNQFNLNGRRYTESEFQAYLGQENAFLMTVSYQDKFGPLGNIAVALGRCAHPVLRIDTWVMSCRAFSRRIEHQCLRWLFDKCQVEAIELDYVPTARNGPLQEFLSGFGEQQPGFRVSRAAFESACPTLFHSVKEIQ